MANINMAAPGRVRVQPDGLQADSVAVPKTARLRPSMRLSLHQLDVFHAVVSTGSITGAARLLNISQPRGKPQPR